jgi:hypothetical protein
MRDAQLGEIVGDFHSRNERLVVAQSVSKRTPFRLSAKSGLSERSISASRLLGRGKVTPQNLAILSFDTASAGSCLSAVGRSRALNHRSDSDPRNDLLRGATAARHVELVDESSVFAVIAGSHWR